MIWVAILAAILVGPIVWVGIRGRGRATTEDASGSTAYGEAVRSQADSSNLGGGSSSSSS